MKFLMSLAWKNLSRHTKRTLITSIAIAFGLGMFIFMDSMFLGLEIESERNLVEYETATAKILHHEYYEEKLKLPLKYTIDDPDAVVKAMNDIGVPAVPRIVFSGEAIVNEDPYAQDGSMQVQVIALDPEKDNTVYELGRAEILDEGEFLKTGTEGVLIGSWLAKDLGAKIGYPITIVTRTKAGASQTIDVTVAGIITSPNPMLNKGTIFMPIDQANAALEMDGTVTEISLKLPDFRNTGGDIGKVKNALGSLNGSIEVLSWKEFAKDYIALASAKRGGSSIMLFFVFIIAAVGISNTMLMAIFERLRELGMMRAMGMQDSQIRSAFILEAAGIGLLGAIGGIIFGTLVNIYMVNVGIDFSSVLPPDIDIGYRVATVFRSVWNPMNMVITLVFGVGMSGLMAFLATRKAMKITITQCLRDQ